MIPKKGIHHKSKTKNMKSVILGTLFLLCIGSLHAQSTNSFSPNDFVGEWQLDMTPNDSTDSNFALMRIEKVDDKGFYGVFYREGVAIEEGRINTQTAHPYGALVSRDNSGSYNTSFYFKEGKLFGSTHAIDRDFLAVWTATKKSGK
jgi:hypothetical protein